jgi:hypothetical protein
MTAVGALYQPPGEVDLSALCAWARRRNIDVSIGPALRILVLCLLRQASSACAPWPPAPSSLALGYLRKEHPVDRRERPEGLD